MSVSYDLLLANCSLNEAIIRKVLKSLSIEVVGVRILNSGFYFYEFEPNIKLQINYSNRSDYPTGHPYSSFETMFISDDFHCNYILSYDLEKNVEQDEAIIQYKLLLSSVMELTKISHREVLFTINSEDAFYYKNGIFFFEKNFYNFIEINQHYKGILQKHECEIFDGKYLR